MHETIAYICTLEHRTGIKIARLEEMGLELGWIDAYAALAGADGLGATGYAHYLRRRVRELAR
ncbi:hypothetical protein MTsPCn7_07170 [Altererythrobacter sp. MTPC7]